MNLNLGVKLKHKFLIYFVISCLTESVIWESTHVICLFSQRPIKKKKLETGIHSKVNYKEHAIKGTYTAAKVRDCIHLQMDEKTLNDNGEMC